MKYTLKEKPSGFDERLQHSIELLRKAEKIALKYDAENGYFLAFSGGKDSQALYHVAKLAGVKFRAHMNFTSVDPPQVIRFVRKQYPDVITHAPHKSIYQLAIDRGILPSMRIRWCCADLKETAGAGKVTLIGIRKAESARRAKRHEVEVQSRKFSGSLEEFGEWQAQELEKRAAKLIMSNQKWFKFDFVWDKVRKSNFLNCKKMPMRQHEQVLVFYDKPPTYNPQMVRCEPHQRNHSRGKLNKPITNTCYGKFGATETIVSDFKYPGTIVKCPKGHSKADWLHSTEKPVNLLRWLIRTYSNEGDLVLDNFAGSGSTLIAAIEEKRDWIGMEIDEKFYNIAKKRIENEKIQPRLF